VLATLETYYDAAPRPNSTTEEVGPFTVFVKVDPDSWEYYARPRLGLDGDVTREDVDAVRARQRELGLPENLEWVHETTPSLLPAALASGLTVDECPLLVFADPSLEQGFPRRVDAEVTGRVRVLGPDDDLGSVVGAIHAGFAGTDEVTPRTARRQPALMRAGLLTMAAAYDDQGAVLGGGSHGPRGTTTELTGIAVLPRARRRGVGAAITGALVEDAHAQGVRTVFLSAQDDAVARVYERVGFVRVGTACIASAPSADLSEG
jgi:ribosomal protein S18 acetylase RimI-like enzyme